MKVIFDDDDVSSSVNFMELLQMARHLDKNSKLLLPNGQIATVTRSYIIKVINKIMVTYNLSILNYHTCDYCKYSHYYFNGNVHVVCRANNPFLKNTINFLQLVDEFTYLYKSRKWHLEHHADLIDTYYTSYLIGLALIHFMQYLSFPRKK